MQPRTRAVLAALNIPVWMGRGGSVQRARVSLWRDQLQVDPAPQSELSRPVIVAETRAQSARFIPNTSVPPAVSDISPPHAPPSLSAREAFMPPIALHPGLAEHANDVVTEPLTVEPVVTEPLLRFSVQARLIGAWIVLVPEQTLQDAACQRLWDNIGQAMQASAPESFIWPLAEGVRWQRMQGVSAAFAGFLHRLGKTQRVGLMGDLADQVCPERIERLPSLTDLLANPSQKRSLWLLLRSDVIG